MMMVVVVVEVTVVGMEAVVGWDNGAVPRSRRRSRSTPPGRRRGLGRPWRRTRKACSSGRRMPYAYVFAALQRRGGRIGCGGWGYREGGVRDTSPWNHKV